MKCLSCKREKELRFGYCFDCADIESIIVDGVDMYDKGLGSDGLKEFGGNVGDKATSSLQKVQLLAEKGYLKYV